MLIYINLTTVMQKGSILQQSKEFNSLNHVDIIGRLIIFKDILF